MENKDLGCLLAEADATPIVRHAISFPHINVLHACPNSRHLGPGNIVKTDKQGTYHSP